MPPIELLLKAWLLGWSVAAPIGPVNLEIIRRTLKNGLLAGASLGIGATLADAMYMLLTSFGLTPLLGHRSVVLVVYLAGGGLFSYMASTAMRDALEFRKGMHRRNTSDCVKSSHGAAFDTSARRLPSLIAVHLALGFAITAANPMTLAFWATLPALFFGPEGALASEVLLATGFVWLGTISWVVTLLTILTVARRLVGRALFPLASGIGGVVMGWFALLFLWRAAGVLTRV